MATADELLSASGEGYIIIGNDRYITVPSNLKRLAVQFDHNIETVTFKCPRYWDDHDMSKMAVYVNYMRSDGYPDRYPVDNLRVEGDIMHFDWTISRNVSEVVGTISFLVCVMKTDSEGNEERHWNSELCSECYVSQGMETEEHPALEYPDEVTQLLLRMSTVEQINVQAEEMRTLYENTAAAAEATEEAKNLALDASGYIKNSYAPAIKGDVSGETIRVDDVSPIEHDVKCRIHGKNLFDGNLQTGYIADTSLRLTEVASSVYRTMVVHLKRGTYTLSSSVKLLILRIVNNGRYYNAGPIGTTYTFDVENDGVFAISFRAEPTADWREYTLLQLESGPVATGYEPWVDPREISVLACGKNIIDPEMMDTTLTNNGVTVTRNGDVLTFSGTATSDIVLFNTKFCYYGGIGNDYTLSYNYVGGGISGTATLCVGDSDDPDAARNSWANIQLKTNVCGSYTAPAIKNYIKDLWFYCTAGTAFTSFKIQVQLERGSESTGFEEFRGDVYTPEVDGTIDVVSASPTTTLIPSKAGVTIEAEYNRDTTKMFESYVLTDKAKAEIAGMVENDMIEVLASLNEYATSLIGGGA